MTCAHCKFFTTVTDPARAAAGKGHCIGFLAELRTFVEWDDAECSLYRKAQPSAAREAWISAREAQKHSSVASANVDAKAGTGPPLSERKRTTTSA